MSELHVISDNLRTCSQKWPRHGHRGMVTCSLLINFFNNKDYSLMKKYIIRNIKNTVKGSKLEFPQGEGEMYKPLTSILSRSAHEDNYLK